MLSGLPNYSRHSLVRDFQIEVIDIFIVQAIKQLKDIKLEILI